MGFGLESLYLGGTSPVAQLPCGRPGFDPWIGKIPWRKERLPTPVFWPGEFRELYRPWGCKESDTTERLSLQTQVALEVNDPPANAGDIRDVRDTGLWVSEIPWRRKWQPTPGLLPGESHGQRSLAGYSPWGREESDTTE